MLGEGNLAALGKKKNSCDVSVVSISLAVKDSTTKLSVVCQDINTDPYAL